jgi:hypothetical protein
MIRAVIAATAMAAALLTGAPPVEAGAAPVEAGAAPAEAGAAPVEAGAARAEAHAERAGDQAQPQARTQLTLSYMAEAGYAVAVVLRCHPPGGGHPRPVKACNALASAGGVPSNLIPARTMCMMIYAPVTAKVAGTWNGRRVNWSRKYGNTCEMNRATGVLFTF